ncbi:hypothetical protein V6N13_086159 [Hibiscus sabdariffa]|uniref:Uncharacterized protein n=1 Tax=Hibiscus sabdariffa TaxID=183260 RepID=A0ABR2FSC3_9ROSI
MDVPSLHRRKGNQPLLTGMRLVVIIVFVCLVCVTKNFICNSPQLALLEDGSNRNSNLQRFCLELISCLSQFVCVSFLVIKFKAREPGIQIGCTSADG